MWCSIILILFVFGQNVHCESTLNGKYYLGQDLSSYSRAIQTCESRGMQLASMENKEKNDEISQIMTQKNIQESCWVSGRTLPDRSSWMWLTGKQVKYENWYPARLRFIRHVATDNCMTVARLRDQLYWDGQLCIIPRCYICEHPRSESNQYQISVHVDDHLTEANTGDQRRRKEFHVSNLTGTYLQAKIFCRSKSMELLSIYNEAENEEIIEVLSTDTDTGASWKDETSTFWTSGHRNSSEHPWQWSFDKNVTYFSWRSGEPNNAQGIEYCLIVKRLNDWVRWMDHNCNDPRRFVCQTVIPKVDIIVNGELVVYRGQTKDRATVSSQERPFQVFVDVKSAPATGTRKHFIWNYFISNDKVRQSDARLACENRDEHLLIIENKEKNERVFSLLEKQQLSGAYWTSATRNSPVSPWRWGNGDPVMYYHWRLRPIIPTTLGETCMEIRKTDVDVTWSYLSCNDTRQYICENMYVDSVKRTGGISLDVLYDNNLVYSNDSTEIAKHY